MGALDPADTYGCYPDAQRAVEGNNWQVTRRIKKLLARGEPR